MPYIMLTPPTADEKPRLKKWEPTGKYERRITRAFKPGLKDKELRPARTGELDTQLVQGLKAQTPRERALDYLTMGMIGGQGGYEKEINFTPEGKMFRKDLPPTAEIPIWEDPIMAGASGIVGALKAPGTIGARLARGGAETLADVTGGASGIPGMLKNARGQRLIPQLPGADVPAQSRLRAPAQIKVISAPKKATKATLALPAPAEPKWEKWPGEYGMQEVLIKQYPELGQHRKTLKAGQKIDVNNLHRLGIEPKVPTLKPTAPKMEAPPAAPTLKAPKRTRQGGKGPETIRGVLQSLGKVDFLHYTGELRSLPKDVRSAIAKKGGYPIDLAEKYLKDEGYLEPGEDLIEMLRTDPVETMRRRPNTIDITERERYLTPKERQFKEDMEWEPDMPAGFDPDAPGDTIKGYDGKVVPFSIAGAGAGYEEDEQGRPRLNIGKALVGMAAGAVLGPKLVGKFGNAAPKELSQSTTIKQIHNFQNKLRIAQNWAERNYRRFKGTGILGDIKGDIAEAAWDEFSKRPDMPMSHFMEISKITALKRLGLEGYEIGKKGQTLRKLEGVTKSAEDVIGPSGKPIGAEAAMSGKTSMADMETDLLERKSGNIHYQGETFHIGRNILNETFDDFVQWIKSAPEFKPWVSGKGSLMRTTRGEIPKNKASIKWSHVPSEEKEGTFFMDEKVLSKIGLEQMMNNLTKEERLFLEGRHAGKSEIGSAKVIYPKHSTRTVSRKAAALKKQVAEKITKYMPAVALAVYYERQKRNRKSAGQKDRMRAD